jgi:hypothetical protein
MNSALNTSENDNMAGDRPVYKQLLNDGWHIISVLNATEEK